MGPAVASYEKIVELIDAGMNVARINMAHGSYEEHREIIKKLKRARLEKEIPLAIMIDTKGPEIRIGRVKNDALSLAAGQRLLLFKKSVEGDQEGISIHPPEVLDEIDEGTAVLFDDGYITSTVVERKKEGVVVEIKNSGLLKSRKGVNIPHKELHLPHLTEKDLADLKFASEEDVEFIAASFICTASDILDIKKILAQHGAGKILVIAKIENAIGVKNFDAILQVADGIMVARGDLGVELPITEIPRLQKEMIRKCYHTSKPVVTATQMLESMISSPRPTRAEVSDVANAIYDHSSAVMLSGETAVGKYPIEAVKMMKAATLAAEEDVNYAEFFYTDVARRVFSDISSCVALAAVKTAYSANGKALIAFSTSGFTARLISRFRPQMPIIALTPDEKTYHQLAFNWGVVPFLKKVKDFKEGFAEASSFALRKSLVAYGDLVVVTSGTPFGVIGTTNVMIVDNIGDVLIRTAPSEGQIVHGSLKLFPSDEMLKSKISLKGKIAVLSRCDGEFETFLQGAAAILLQNHPDDSRSEWEAKAIAKALKIPCLVRADGAFAILKDGEIVTLDPGRGLLFKGIFEAP